MSYTTNKKGLFISLDHVISEIDMDLSEVNSGIVKKIVNQYQCLQNYGFDMELYCPYENRNHRVHSIIRRLPFSGIIPFKGNYINRANEFSFIYLRRPWFMNSDVPLFLNKMKKNNPYLKIIMEVPTYDAASSDKGEINHWHMWPLYWKDQNAVVKLVNSVDRILTFSKDDTIYGIKTICTCNAINPFTTTKVSHVDSKDNEIHLVACSSMAFWHGFDRLIEGLKIYKNSKETDYKIVFHLVGDGEELNRYKELVTSYDLQKEVLFHGYKSGKELDDIYDLCDIAIDSMGRHRSNIYYNSSLKGKEYLAKGLPVVSGVANELDYDPSFKYYLRIPADESPVDIDCVIKFYNRIYCESEERQTVIDNISEYAARHFSYAASFKKLVDYIEESDANKGLI